MSTEVTKQPEFGRLISILNNARVMTTNPALHQFLSQLLDSTKQFQHVTNAVVEEMGEDFTGDIEELQEQIGKIIIATFLTSSDESEDLPFSKKLVAGAGVVFDDSVANQRIISSTGGGGGSITIITREIPVGLINGTNTTFTLANTPVANSEQVFLNGLLQDIRGIDYSISGADITFLIPPLSGDRILVTYQKV